MAYEFRPGGPLKYKIKFFVLVIPMILPWTGSTRTKLVNLFLFKVFVKSQTVVLVDS